MREDQHKNIFVGTWLTIGSTVSTELASLYPFDWLLLDMEHGFITESSLLHNLQSIRKKETEAIVRIPTFSSSLIGKALDWGATGIMLPHVNSVKSAVECIKAMRYAPEGNRGFSGSVRAYDFGLSAPLETSTVRPLFFAQIEDVEAVENISDIAAVDGVDVLFVGPADLKQSLIANGKKDPLHFDAALEKIASASQKAGKKAGILIRENNRLHVLREVGYSVLGMHSDTSILRNGYKEIFDLVSKE